MDMIKEIEKSLRRLRPPYDLSALEHPRPNWIRLGGPLTGTNLKLLVLLLRGADELEEAIEAYDEHEQKHVKGLIEAESPECRKIYDRVLAANMRVLAVQHLLWGGVSMEFRDKMFEHFPFGCEFRVCPELYVYGIPAADVVSPMSGLESLVRQIMVVQGDERVM